MSSALVGNTIFDHSDVVGASPVGAAPTISSSSTPLLALIYCTKTTARRDEKHLSFGATYIRDLTVHPKSCHSLSRCWLNNNWTLWWTYFLEIWIKIQNFPSTKCLYTICVLPVVSSSDYNGFKCRVSVYNGDGCRNQLKHLQLWKLTDIVAMDMGRSKRVAVIGAGASGLPSIKACLEEGLHPVCYL